MEVRKITPRGYCYGVVDAVVLAQNIALNPGVRRPIYILGMLVHNRYVVEAFERIGVVSLDGDDRLALLDQIESGTVILTAHGVSPEVRRKALEKGLMVVDATCPDVARTHTLIKDSVAEGYEVIYIGRHGHPEPEGAIGVAPDKVHLVTCVEDVLHLELNSDRILVTNQTTMSQWDIADVIEAAVKKYPQAEVYNEICMATQERQEAVAEQAVGCDIVIVVGDPRSNNTRRLAKVAEDVAKVKAYRIEQLAELELEWLKGCKLVCVTSGASTPTHLTREVINFLEQYDENDPDTWEKNDKLDLTRILPKIKVEEE